MDPNPPPITKTERLLAKIAFLLMCHKRSDRVLEQVRVLTSAGDYVAVHADKAAGEAFAARIAAGIADNPNAIMVRRVRCGWGAWSLVRASLNLAGAALEQFADATHFYLISGDCMPIKPAHHIRETLRASGRDWIEHSDFFTGNWIQTGLREERLTRHHFFNERRQKRLFYASLKLQRRLKLTRRLPKGVKVHIGSQWWVLRRSTLESLFRFCRERPDVVRFFRTTWIPDETFFQTLVMHLVPKEEVISRPPTYLVFSDYGMPGTFYADHFGLLRGEDAFFARKISDHDDALRARLGEFFLSNETVPSTGADGRAHYDFIRARGREGGRFGPRIWEAQARLGRGRTVTAIVCKKWHVAKRLVGQLTHISNLPAYGYVFDEDDAGLPPLGNLEGSREKRSLHRRAFLHVLFNQLGTDRLAICLDPANSAAIDDLAGDGCRFRVLLINCEVTPDWLEGHAMRIGLGSRSETGALHGQLMGALRRTVDDEIEGLRARELPNFGEISKGDTPGQMARPLADAFNLSIDQGAALARTEALFD